MSNSATSTKREKVPGSGRRRGVKNKRTAQVEAWLKPLLPGAKRKLKALVSSDDDATALKAALAVVAYIYGKPTQRQELSGVDGQPMLERIERVIVDERAGAATAKATAVGANGLDPSADPHPPEQEAGPGSVPYHDFEQEQDFKIPDYLKARR